MSLLIYQAIKIKGPIGKMEKHVCREFNIKESELSKVGYNNLAGHMMIYIAVEYCGFTIKEVLHRYSGTSCYAVVKAISRIKKRVGSDERLNERVNQILSIVQM